VPTSLFLQNIVAVIWDFDKTLIPGYMQEPLFRHYGVKEATFWGEVQEMPDFYWRTQGLELVSETLYLNHILTYVRQGLFPGLSNRLLRELGAQIEFYPGVLSCFERLQRLVAEKPKYKRHEIKLEHYVVSTGLRQMILGSAIHPYVEDVWACEFVEDVPLPGFTSGRQESLLPTHVLDIGYVIDNTTKTRAVFEINKGTNKIAEITVNSTVRPEDRRVPFQNMIYIADGPSDVPVFSILNQYGGKTFAVYPHGSWKDFRQVRSLLEQGRVQAYGEADFSENTQTDMWLTTSVEVIADRIVADRERALQSQVGPPPGHIIDDDAATAESSTGATEAEEIQPRLDETPSEP
jgi:haloacid dehalogenase-like hydrolase